MNEFKLPKILDPNSGDKVNLIVRGSDDAESYVKYIKKSHKLSFSRKTMIMENDVDLSILLEDNNRYGPGRTEYNITIKCAYCLKFLDNLFVT
jgi:hypothetical protein